MGTINVFVYGTLKPGGTYHHQYCAPFLQVKQLAQVQGRLYNLPALGYPVMTAGSSWVKGYLFTLNAAALAGLDYLEGYCPDGCKQIPEDDFEEDYSRIQTQVYDLTGQPLDKAWVYIMDTPPAGAVWLPEGHWPLPKVTDATSEQT